MEHDSKPILFACPMGHAVRAPRDLAGQVGKCPRCATVLVVPGELEPTTDSQAETPAPPIPTREPKAGRTPFQARTTRKRFIREWNRATHFSHSE